MNYKKAFRIIRATKEYSQKDLALKTGLDRTLISRIEAGDRTPTTKTLEVLSEKLGIPLHLIILLSSTTSPKGNRVSDEEVMLIGKILLKLSCS